MKLGRDLSIGQKFALVWMVWLGIAGAYCLTSISALTSVTGEAEQIYTSRLRPTIELSRAESSLTALGAVLQNPNVLKDSRAVAHGYIPLLRGQVRTALDHYRRALGTSRKLLPAHLRTDTAQTSARKLLLDQARAMDEWDASWSTVEGIIDVAEQPNPPAGLNVAVQQVFGAALADLRRLESINAHLGEVEAQDAQTVSQQARWTALLLASCTLIGTVLLALAQRILLVIPLKKLTRAADLARRGDLTPRVSVRFNDEIGRLTQTFNSMMSALQDAHERLKAQNVELHDHAKALEALAAAEAAQRQAESEASRLKSEFLANMSHELRTPMNSIIGYAQVLSEGMDGPLTSEQQEDVTRILGSGRHLLGLINDILDLSKIESGKMVIEPEWFDLRAVTGPAIATVQPLADQKRIALRTEFADDLPQVFADPPKMRQVLLNLLSNAIKFTSEGSVTLRARRLNDIVEISIIDTGIGIPEAALEYIFEEFRQVDGSTARKYGGTGLGLAISLKLVQLQQGEITVESKQGEGSVFRVTLPAEPGSSRTGSEADRSELIETPPTPVAPSSGDEQLSDRSGSPAQPSDADSSRHSDGAGALSREAGQIAGNGTATGAVKSRSAGPSHGSSNGQDQRGASGVHSGEPDGPLALCIDDDEMALSLLERHLTNAGYRVVTAMSADEGAQRARELKPDVVTLDIMMPRKDGWEALQEFKLDPELADIPVVIVSLVENRQLALALGASASAPKPIEPAILKAAVEHARMDRVPAEVLVVDDDVDTCALVSRILEAENYHTRLASSGREALRIVQETSPDAIVLDLRMPGTSGFQVLAELGRMNNPPPVVILTAMDLNPVQREEIASEIVAIVEKGPYSRFRLIEAVSRAIDTRSSPIVVMNAGQKVVS